MTIDAELKAKIEAMSEIEIYFTVDEAGAFSWRMNHDMNNGRIPVKDHASIRKDVAQMREIHQRAVAQLPRFGITDAFEDDGKTPTATYWAWYKRWSKWHKEDLTDAEWETISRAMRKGEDLSKFDPFKSSDETEDK